MFYKVIILLFLLNQSLSSADDGFHLNATLLYSLGFDSSTTVIYLPFADIVSIDPNTFIGFPNIDTLILSFSRIKTIDSRTFSYLKKLIYLDLHYNQLEQIDDLIFSELTELKLLFLDTNQITVFSRNAFVKLTKLETVCLCENPISNYFPFLLKDICRTNPNCVLSIQECCFNSKTLENFF